MPPTSAASTAKKSHARPRRAASQTAPVTPAPTSAAPDRPIDTPADVAPGGDAGSRDEMIRQAAYSFYEQRGCVDGYDLEDWLNAEAVVTQRLALDGPDRSPRDDRVAE
ncbi:MAG: DUF2934 domain-containing protein [Lautropia sp.]